jgi:4-amino-4-deoxy-L-arabinose transferase-like glycosyltransferase
MAAAALLRFVDLGADPSPFKRFGDVSDEGYWAHDARLWALGVPHADDLCAAGAAAPLLTLALRAVFAAFGVSFASLHLISAVAGMLVVALAGAFASAAWGRRTGIIAAALMAVADAAVIYSRIGHPEMLQTLFLTAALLLLLWPSRWSAFLAGTSLALAVLAKVTAVYYGPAAIAVLWYHRRPGALRALIGFAAGGLIPIALWAPLWFWPQRPMYWAMLRAMAEDDGGGRLLSFSALHVPLNYFLGFPSVALLVVLAVVVLTDRRLREGDRPTSALFLWAGGFLLACVFSADQTDRRFVPLLVPLVLIAARALGRAECWTWTPLGVLCASAAVAVTAYDAWNGSLWNAFGAGLPRALALLALLAGSLGLLYWLRDRGRGLLSRVALGLAAAVFVLPSIAAHLLRTHTLQTSSRELASRIGPEQMATGPLAHMMALEARFYPMFFTPGGKGIGRLNAALDVTRLDYQLVVPRIMGLYGPLGFGRPAPPVLVTKLELLPSFRGEVRWKIDVYRLP